MRHSAACRPLSRAVLLALWLTTHSCGAPQRSPTHRPRGAPAASASVATSQPRVVATTAAPTATLGTPNVPTLPADLRLGEFSRVRLPNYRAALVVHGEANTRRALIYLHGICGNVERIRDWTAAAAKYVTIIALYGNKPCPTSATLFSWNQDIEFIHELAQLALAKVAEARGGLLDVDRAVLFGYSQGASRAERLVERHPESYPWVILGGPPAPPLWEHLRQVNRAAILVGSEEHHEHLRDAAANLSSLGAATRFDIFEGVGHGGFGPRAPQVMTDTLSWLLQD